MQWNCFVGIDVSKETLDLCLVDERHEPAHKASLHTRNDTQGFQELLRWLARHQASAEHTVLCLEKTGLYDDALLEAMTLAGYACAHEKTTASQRVRPEHHRKDDRFDAALLADYARRFADQLSLYRSPDPVIEQLRVLSGERHRLVGERAATTVLRSEGRRRSGVTAFTDQVWQAQQAFFTAQIKAIDQEIQRLIDRDEDLRHRYEQLRGIDGIGPVTALLWVCLFYQQERLDARRISSWLGMAPHRRQSGTSLRRKGHSSGRGMSVLRGLLHQCAQSAMTHREAYRDYKQRKLSEGKPNLVVANNVANKLIRVICAVWNQNGSFDRNYVSPMAALSA